MPKALVDEAVNFFMALIETDSVTVQTIHVGTMNVTASPKASSDAFEPGQGPLESLVPEFGRVLAQQLYMRDRAVVIFSSASASNAPTQDPWTTFRPFKPSLYPSAPACLDFSHGDAALLAEFYGGAQEVDDYVRSRTSARRLTSTSAPASGALVARQRPGATAEVLPRCSWKNASTLALKSA